MRLHFWEKWRRGEEELGGGRGGGGESDSDFESHPLNNNNTPGEIFGFLNRKERDPDRDEYITSSTL